MNRFANAEANWRSLDFLWLAGLLEAEGTFLKPPPSSPRSPIVACRMTDRDVIERVADRFGTSIFAFDRGEYRTQYGACAKGSRAVALMRDLRPFMSARRQAAIDTALDLYVPPSYKLNYEVAQEIRERYARASQSRRWRAGSRLPARPSIRSSSMRSTGHPRQLPGETRQALFRSRPKYLMPSQWTSSIG
jgi:hypothetical protein